MTGALEDRELVEQFLSARDERSFLTLYRRHAPVVYGLLCRLAGHDGNAEDLMQETWIRAVEALPGFRWESALSTWLCGIAINCHRSDVRRRARLRLVQQPETLEPGARDVALERTPDAVDLERAIAELPPGYRDVLVLHDLQGYTHEDVGRLLGIAPGTSKSQLHHARRALRTRLGGSAGRRAGDGSA